MTVTDPAVGFDQVVLLGNAAGGLAFMPGTTPLTRLNYYDGKFLRADDLTLEQRSQRMLVQLSNQAGGPGVVHGFDVTRLDAARLRLSPGLAIDPEGRVLLLPVSVDVTLAALLDAMVSSTAPVGSPGAAATASGTASFAPCEVATAAPPGVTTVSGTELYLVCMSHAEGLCGNAEVFGRLCDEACVTATDRPYRLDGVLLKLVPLALHRPLPTSTAVTLTPDHLRSRVASAFFGDEWDRGGSLLHRSGLRAKTWCLGATDLTGAGVCLGVLARSGSAIAFIDEWTVRRERIDTPPRRYWAGRMEMRPWDVFLAQVLQFQCQLADLLAGAPAPGRGGGKDPCADAKTLLSQTAAVFDALTARAEPAPEIVLLASEVRRLLEAPAAVSDKVLVDGGIVELPAAGYLPVDRTGTVTLEDQVRLLVGDGLDLRFCAVRRDQIAHELERAQHMERISLLAGLDDATQRQRVDILVPDGELVQDAPAGTGVGFTLDLALGSAETVVAVPVLVGTGRAPAEFADRVNADPARLLLRGAVRFEQRAGGISVRVAALGAARKAPLRAVVRFLAGLIDDGSSAGTRAKRLRDLDVSVEAAQPARTARDVNERAIAHRATRAGGRVVSLPTANDVEALALWATFDLHRDPFATPVGQGCPFEATVEVFVPSKPSVLVERRLEGQARVLAHGGTPQRPEVRVRATGLVHGDNVNLSNASTPGRVVEAELVFTRATVGGSPVLVVRSSDADQAWRVFLQWSVSPIEAVAGFGEVSRSGSPATGGSAGGLLPDRVFVEANLAEDPTVGNPGNPYHDQAFTALTMLQGAEPDEPKFLATAVAELFPAAAGGIGATIRGKHDWVLFRRRRRKECAAAAPPPPPPPSQVAAWVATAANNAQAVEWTGMLQGGKGDGVPWARLANVEFEAATAQRRTAAATVRADWVTHDGGDHLKFAGYGMYAGTADPTGVPRAEAVVDALDPVAPLDDSGKVDMVANPPAMQQVTGTDASLFLIAYSPPEVTSSCVEVILVDEVDRGDGLKLREAIQAGDPGQVAAMAARLKSLGNVRFEGTSPVIDTEFHKVDGALKVVVSDHSDKQDPRRELPVVWIDAQWASKHEGEATQQAFALAKVFGAQLVKEHVLVVDLPASDRCPVAFFVLLPRIQPG